MFRLYHFIHKEVPPCASSSRSSSMSPFFTVTAESHKTLQALICDILFPCGNRVTSDAQEKLRIGGGVCKDMSCQKQNVWKREGSTSARKMALMVPG